MKRLLFILSMMVSVAVHSQTTGFFRYDTVALQKIGGNSELKILNSTRGITGGVLTNIGNGRTRFVIPTSNTIDVFLIAGQSNAQGWGSTTGSPIVKTGTVFQYNNGVITAGNDPIGNANTGSAWPSFGITYNTLTGHLVCFVPAGFPGSSQTAAAESGGNGTWDTTGNKWDTSVARLNSALIVLAANAYSPIFKGVLWVQGETDADAINASTITQAAYIAAFAKMRKKYRTLYGKTMPFYIFRTGTKSGGSDVGYASVRAAQLSAMNGDSLTNIVFYNAKDFVTRSLMVDAYHYTQPGYNEMGRIGAQTIVNSGFNTFQPQDGNLYYTNGNIGIGMTAPLYRLQVDDSVKLSGMAFNRASEFNGPQIATAEWLSIIAHGVNGQTRNLIQLLPGKLDTPVELRLSSGSGGSSMPNGVGVINFYNNDGPERQAGRIISSGFNGTDGGSIEIIPGVRYVTATKDFTFAQYNGDSVIIKLNPDAAYRPYFYVRGREHLTDSLKLDNIAYYTSDLHGKFNSRTLIDKTYADSIGNAGEYTPTLANVTNIASTTSGLVNYQRTGAYCHVEGRVSCTTTTGGGVFSTLSLTLPFASAMTVGTDLNGVANARTSAAITAGVVVANVSTDVAEINFYSGTGGTDLHFSFTYKIK